MGNCAGKPHIVGARSSSGKVPFSATGIRDRASLNFNGDSLSLAASSAHFSSSPYPNTFSTVHKCSPDTLLIALFEGIGADMKSAAAAASLAQGLLLQTFTENSQRYPGDSAAILQATLQSLHHQCLASIPPSKHSGVSATLALVNLSTLRCTVANVGNTRCLLAGVSGSFNSKRPQSSWISALHTTENPKERVHAAARQGTCGKILGIEARLPALLSDNNSTQDLSTVTRALGMTLEGQQGSRKKATTRNFDIEISTSEIQLSQVDGHLILGSSGFWNLVAPYSAALRAHLFTKFLDAQKAASAAAIRDGIAVPSPATRGQQPAEHLVRYALSIASDRLSSTLGANVTAEDIHKLPFERAIVDFSSSEEAPEITAMPLGSTSLQPASDTFQSHKLTLNSQDHLQVEDIIRGDVIGDLGCIVMALRWPGQAPDAQPNPPPRLYHSVSKYGGKSEQFGQNGVSSDLAALAKYRWAQIRMEVDSQKLHRREVLQRWHETVQGIMQKARKRAKDVAERVKMEQGFAVHVSPLMKLSTVDGTAALPAEAFDVKATINF